MRTLYMLNGCPFGHRASFALEEKGIAYESVFFAKSSRPPELEAIGRFAKSPTLFDGDVKIYDSIVVLEYLEDRFPEHPLMLPGVAGRADVRMLVARICSELGPKFVAVMREAHRREPDQAKLADARKGLDEQCAVWDAHLAGRTFAAGAVLTIADIVLYTFFPALSSVAKVEIAPELSSLRGWFERISARPAAELRRPTVAPA